MYVRTRGNKGTGTCLWNLAAGTHWILFLLSWLQTHGRMENGGQDRLSTQESSLLTAELDPTPSIRNKGYVFHTISMCRIGMSVVCDSRVAAALAWGLHTWDCEEYNSWGFIEADLCVWGSPYDARKGKYCCLDIKGRTLFAPTCIAWWVLWLRNNTAGAILLLLCSGFSETSLLVERYLGWNFFWRGSFHKERLFKRKS